MNNKNNTKFNGNLLKSCRKKLGLSLEKLGKSLDYSRQTIYKYEKGLCNPDYGFIDDMIDFFNKNEIYVKRDDFLLRERDIALTNASDILNKKPNKEFSYDSYNEENSAKIASIGINTKRLYKLTYVMDSSVVSTDIKSPYTYGISILAMLQNPHSKNTPVDTLNVIGGKLYIKHQDILRMKMVNDSSWKGFYAKITSNRFTEYIAPDYIEVYDYDIEHISKMFTEYSNEEYYSVNTQEANSNGPQIEGGKFWEYLYPLGSKNRDQLESWLYSFTIEAMSFCFHNKSVK
jgi:transcriptional regulator with XRE-family HTH domain